tara:strand:- start:148 stop:852 length:705 start_codon:yes stop_codon:yes gene_type:complete
MSFTNIILIPYRNRESQLKKFLNDVVPLVIAHMPKTKVVFIEQNEGKGFNRGKILNVGFQIFKEETEYFITNDVDTYPLDKCILKYYNKPVGTNEVLAILTSDANTMGGTIKIKSESIHKINGFPNNIWGWGAEDRALQNRAYFFHIKKKKCLTTKQKNKNSNPEYFLVLDDIREPRIKNYHETHRIFHYKKFKNFDSKKKKEIIFESGLNNLDYNIIKREILGPCAEIITVNI